MTLADILNLLKRLPAINLQLDNPNTISDMTWFSVTESRDNLKVVYIFRGKEDELLVARNGKVQEGKWDFISNTNALFVKFGGEKDLHNALLLKGHYLVLRKDGTETTNLLVNQAYYQKILESAPKRVLEFIHRDLKLFVPEVEELDFTLDFPKEQDDPEEELPAVAKQTIDALTSQIEIKEAKQEATQVPRKIVEHDSHEATGAASIEEAKNSEPEEVAEPTAEDQLMEEAELAKDKADDTDSLPAEEEPKEESIFERLKKEKAETQTGKSLFGAEKKPSLNDKLKESLQKKKEPSLLEKLAEKNKKDN